MKLRMYLSSVALFLLLGLASVTHAQVAVHAKVMYPAVGRPQRNVLIMIEQDKITSISKFAGSVIPGHYRVLTAEVVTPGLIDAHTVVGLTGIYNLKHDQDQLERSSPIQPELRAIDAYNPHERLISWVRGFGITTIHTGHAPGELISGQTMIAKTYGNTVEEALLVSPAMLAATLGRTAQKKEKGKSPGTRGKMMSMLRADFIKAREYLNKLHTAADDKKPNRDLRLESLGLVLRKKIPLLVTAHRAQDIANAIRLKEEFNIKVILDGGSESYLMTKELKKAGISVIVHPPMARAFGEMENASYETPLKLKQAGIMVAMQSGYESYVPKTRVLLLEAALAAANGLSLQDVLKSITIDAAHILGIADRVGSIEVGKDADLALYDGDPFEFTTHCTGVIINGEVVSTKRR